MQNQVPRALNILEKINNMKHQYIPASGIALSLLFSTLALTILGSVNPGILSFREVWEQEVHTPLASFPQMIL